jgi:Phosphoglucomutase
MLAVTGKNPAQQYAELTARFGTPCYARMDAPASSKQKEALKKTLPEKHHNRNACRRGNFGSIDLRPGNGGTDLIGLKVTTANGWFAARHREPRMSIKFMRRASLEKPI